MANSADPDQLASSEANWSGSTLFAKKGISGFSRTRVNMYSCEMTEEKQPPGRRDEGPNKNFYLT